MASRTSNFCIDAADPYAQTMWWAQVLDDHRLTDEGQNPGDEECGLEGPDGRWLLFLKVPEPKSVKNRMHVCLRPTDRTRDEEVDRLLGLGATLVNDLRNAEDGGWAVLADPEGNEFCVLREVPAS
ncbi:VOC family protein [Lapillicoccus sp.]|uniref:VOC family protein n=1 Tax=Lapillicoccus sp. TaxID=1909287 RepID=UPI0039834020